MVARLRLVPGEGQGLRSWLASAAHSPPGAGEPGERVLAVLVEDDFIWQSSSPAELRLLAGLAWPVGSCSCPWLAQATAASGCSVGFSATTGVQYPPSPVLAVLAPVGKLNGPMLATGLARGAAGPE